jgi:hypothetical protein
MTHPLEQEFGLTAEELDEMNHQPLLSAIVVVGACRKRAQRVVKALCAQTVVGSIEIIIMDLAPADAARLVVSPNAPVTYLSRPDIKLWSHGRAEGVQHARAPIVAFIEDHCFPAPNWAETLIETHKGLWAAVGYAFTNANPETYMSRASMINDYGVWLHPARRGPTASLPGHNISYKRDALLSVGDELEALLTPDFNLHQALRRRELVMFLESQALVAHENFTTLSALMSAHYTDCRLLGARRAEVESWKNLKRIFYGLAVLPGAPLLAMVRLLLSLRDRASLWPAVITALPVYALTRFWAAVGESAGSLFGLGNAERAMHRWELEIERTTRD